MRASLRRKGQKEKPWGGEEGEAGPGPSQELLLSSPGSALEQEQHVSLPLVAWQTVLLAGMGPCWGLMLGWT